MVLTSHEHSVKVAVEWKGGEVTELRSNGTGGVNPLSTGAEVVELVRRLAVEDGLYDTQIARVLI